MGSVGVGEGAGEGAGAGAGAASDDADKRGVSGGVRGRRLSSAVAGCGRSEWWSLEIGAGAGAGAGGGDGVCPLMILWKETSPGVFTGFTGFTESG